MATALAAGWYADPADSTQYRYWTGDQWTAHVRDRSQVDQTAGPRPLPDFDLADIVVPPPSTNTTATEGSRRPRRVPALLAVIALLVLVATAGVVTLSDSDPSGSGGPTLTGEVRVAADQAKGGGDRSLADGARCGVGAPPGIGAGTRVTVRNARGEALGRTELRAGQVDRTRNSITCVFTYEIGAVADAVFYSVQVAGRTATRLTAAQLEASGWRADLRLG